MYFSLSLPPLYLHPIVAPCSFPTFSSSTTTPRPSIFPPRKRSKQKLPPIHFPTSNFRLELYQRSFYPRSLNPSPHLSTTSYAVKSRNTPQIWDGWKDPPFRWIYVNHVEESLHVGKFVGAPSISSIDLKQSNMCDVSWVKVKRVVYRYIYTVDISRGFPLGNFTRAIGWIFWGKIVFKFLFFEVCLIIIIIRYLFCKIV